MHVATGMSPTCHDGVTVFVATAVESIGGVGHRHIAASGDTSIDEGVRCAHSVF